MTHIYADVIDGALFAAHQAGALGHDIGTLSEWRDALLAVRAQALEDAALACEAQTRKIGLRTWRTTAALREAYQECAAAIRALKEKT